MRKTALILIMLTLSVISANFVPQEAIGQDDAGAIIENISDTHIVIGDDSYRIASDAVFLASDGKTIIDFSRFNIGDPVEFTTNGNGEIVELYKTTGR